MEFSVNKCSKSRRLFVSRRSTINPFPYNTEKYIAKQHLTETILRLFPAAEWPNLT